MRNVCIALEHPIRELDQSVLMHLALKNRNINSTVSSALHTIHFDFIKCYHAIISPWGHGDHEFEYVFEYAEKFHNKFKKVVFWQEQVLSKRNLLRLLPKGKSLNSVEYHLVWGNRFAKQLIEGGVPAERIIITGSPRIDLLHPIFVQSYNSRESLAKEFNLDLKKKWLFFPSSFKINFLTPALKKIRIEHGFKDLEKFIEYFNQNFQDSVNILKNAAEALGSDFEIIVRPHPSEPTLPYSTAFKHHTGVHVIKKYPIAWWLNASDIILATKSTSTLEGFILGKKIILIDFPPIQDTEPDYYDYQELFPRINTAEEFLEELTRTRNLSLSDHYGKTYEALNAYVKDAYGFLDGFSHQRVAFLLDEFTRDVTVSKNKSLIDLHTLNMMIGDVVKTNLLRFPSIGKKLMPQYVENRQMDYFSKRQVKNAIQRYESITNSLQQKHFTIQSLNNIKTVHE